jgi:hypothetical protein
VLDTFGKYPRSINGQKSGTWIDMDYGIGLIGLILLLLISFLSGNTIIHIMTPPLREYYKLERRWSKAEILDMNYLFKDRPQIIRNYLSPKTIVDLNIPTDPVEQQEDSLDKPDDPFWS